MGQGMQYQCEKGSGATGALLPHPELTLLQHPLNHVAAFSTAQVRGWGRSTLLSHASSPTQAATYPGLYTPGPWPALTKLLPSPSSSSSNPGSSSSGPGVRLGPGQSQNAGMQIQNNASFPPRWQRGEKPLIFNEVVWWKILNLGWSIVLGSLNLNFQTWHGKFFEWEQSTPSL